MRATSSDGTAIAYEEGGSGPSVVLVHGALSDRRHAFGAVRPLLERWVTVYALDRRGHAGVALGREPVRVLDLELAVEHRQTRH